MKKITLSAFALLMVCGVANAAPTYTNEMYVAARAGYSATGVGEGFSRIDASDEIATYGLAIGSEFMGSRVELELGSRSEWEHEGSTLNSYNAMINVFYDFQVNAPVKPFVGVGAGLSWNEFEFAGFAEDNYDFAWQVMAGLNWEVSKELTMELGYKYFQIDNFEFADGENTDIFANEFTVGARYKF